MKKYLKNEIQNNCRFVKNELIALFSICTTCVVPPRRATVLKYPHPRRSVVLKNPLEAVACGKILWKKKRKIPPVAL